MLNESEKNTGGIKIWIPLLLSLMLVAGMLIGMRMQRIPLVSLSSSDGATNSSSIETGRVEELVRFIESRYVDEVNSEELVEEAINALLKQLDPHSNYISAKQVREVNEQLDGNFEGVGIEFMILDDTIRVISPISGGPSEAVGIMAGDKIVQIEDSIVAGVNVEVKDIVEFLRGEKGSEVEVGILRGEEKEVRKFTITRDKIPLNSVDVAYMIDDQTGYIKISRFSATTYKEFMEGVERMVEKENMKDVIIDVRQNPGGYLLEATNILSQLFEQRGRLLVYTEGRSVRRSEYESTGRPFFELGKVAVLIDEGSASASEILAGAIQDWDRGPVIGRRSFGKGLVQEQYGLRDGSALRLTVARYYTPSGRCIQKPYNDRENYNQDVQERFSNGELVSQDSIAQKDTTRFYTSEGRVVYGGGGITPDIFIPLDTLLLESHYINHRQLIPEFVYRYLENKDDIYNGSPKDFSKNYTVDRQMVEAFRDYAASKGIERNDAKWAKSADDIVHLIKARIGRHLYQEEGYYQVWNETDPAVLEALRNLRTERPQVVEK
ncbi:MAG: S41 family peptidase [Bacteroidota bacterium]